MFEKIREAFIDNFGHLHLKISDDELSNRRKGSMPYGSGRLFYIFGEEGGREYLEYYAYHQIGGDGHGKIYDHGGIVESSNVGDRFCLQPEYSWRCRA